ncbi:rhodanese-like domain-containing protein [Cryobacterium sp.]|jgi:rhodanese-related sulfurtransferase|uniref:rhodanese-like domain-containing protein n=1 Tax=Cryobacterium sp. TaxID=1926290 RepID=UPI002624B1B6|nr:rhodanese-like domain-containing protein [Cryobacterium sp.]MCU1446220.1 sulfurtransferase [Cryobacterium sp.]MCU1542529.1 sulfurtransferase [Microbacteriaceae bacterium]
MTDQTTTTPATAEPELLDAEAAAAWVHNGAVLIDVRSLPTRERVGGISGATVVDRERLPELFGADSPERLTQVHSDEHPIVVVCGSVAGSRPVADWLVEHGHTAVAHVEGGFEAWKVAGQPTTPGTES